MNKIFLNYFIVLLSLTASCNQVLIRKSVTLDSQKYYKVTLSPTEEPESVTGWKIPNTNKEAFEELNSMLPYKLTNSLKIAANSIDNYSKVDNCYYSYRIDFANNFEIDDSTILNNQLFYSDFLYSLGQIWKFDKKSKLMDYYHVQNPENLIQLIVEIYSARLLERESKLSIILKDSQKLRQEMIQDPCELK